MQMGFDLIIVGAGPGGLSAALWARELGLSAIILESADEPGGQLLSTFNPIRNHLGAEAADGRSMRDGFLRQFVGGLPEIRFGVSVRSIGVAPTEVELSDGTTIAGRGIVIATGVRRRRLGVAGEVEFAGRGIIASGKRDSELAHGKDVVIVGGGDAALENCLILGETANSVTLVHRRASFSARPEFVAATLAHPKVEVVKNSVVESIEGSGSVESVLIRDRMTGELRSIAAGIVLIRIGVEPNTSLANGVAALDGQGYLIVDSECRTSAGGVWAVGDCACPTAPTISTAVGMGATAAKAIFSWLRQ